MYVVKYYHLDYQDYENMKNSSFKKNEAFNSPFSKTRNEAKGNYSININNLLEPLLESDVTD